MKLNLGGLSRRDFMKYCATTAALLGLPKVEFANRVSESIAAAANSNKPAVIWLEGQDCAGCTVSFAGSLFPPVASLILDKLSVRYHETIMAAAGDLSHHALEDTVKQGGYVLVVEGSIPTKKGFCTINGKEFIDIVKDSAKNAAAVIAVGACASFGGIPAAGPTGAVGVDKVIKDKPVINLSTCPVHAEHLVETVLYFLVTKKVPPLDENKRPVMFFGPLIHDNCRRRAAMEEDKYLIDWNDPKQKDWCLLKMGCKGSETSSDCPIRRWNYGQNFCIDCGAGCKGCAEPTFYAGMTPLYAEEE